MIDAALSSGSATEKYSCSMTDGYAGNYPASGEGQSKEESSLNVTILTLCKGRAWLGDTSAS